MPLIVFEGVDGCGKSTQQQLLKARLEQAGYRIEEFRDPGGTALGEQVRALLLDPANDVGRAAELFGYLLSRAQLVHERLRPALASGAVVLLDRFWYSTIAYQCFGLGLDRALVQGAVDLANEGLVPDRALWFRVPVAEAARRRAEARGEPDRIEARGLAYLEQVASGYQALADEGAMTVIAADAPPQVVHGRVWQAVEPVLPPGC